MSGSERAWERGDDLERGHETMLGPSKGELKVIGEDAPHEDGSKLFVVRGSRGYYASVATGLTTMLDDARKFSSAADARLFIIAEGPSATAGTWEVVQIPAYLLDDAGQYVGAARKSRRIYLASSWRNERQPEVLALLREAGHEVYDFRNPMPGDDGFHWTEVDPEWRQWNADRFRDGLRHPIAQAGFESDFNAMKWADTGVLLLPCGRSAHLEAGYFVGAGKPLYILLADGCEPELMYLMGTSRCISDGELLADLARPKGGAPC